ncbi:bifunctional diaminohydroxyphosphoribosylaminopyrimidine deaminase/5-amino-6-(5-phosphoribosylamino)uracil reductase RibD [Ectobacillus polymachus]|uniref:bifunctional diaminohydroxyphosphoribosylaminopyrimidine deaminase/5-amino-6-(5-phosphoribosylamino)uracil reductase RibD n=1 Tax=Ectobacillus polymachus TaxID=1508806 RepID=UPI003A88B20E
MTDEEYMRLALHLAANTQGQTSPNPMVGAIIVQNGSIVGIGAHLRAGEAHAEVHAIKMAGDKAQGSTVYVTLEPCSHFGKTPPCCDLLIDKGVKRVVIATLDSNPLVSGQGVQRLQEAGIQVDVGILEAEAKKLNEIFFHYMATKKPFVTLKAATSLDGKIATSSGESKWITGKLSREDVHQYRNNHDGILVGVNTVITDNPSLTTRLHGGGKNPIRIVLDTYLRTPLSSNLVKDGEAPTWIIVGAHVQKEKIKQYEAYGVAIIQMKSPLIEIDPLLSLLGERGILSLLVEGGQHVHASFLEGGYWDRLILYMSPRLIGGVNAPSFFGGKGFSSLQDTPLLSIQKIEMIGEDIKLIAHKRGVR